MKEAYLLLLGREPEEQASRLTLTEGPNDMHCSDEASGGHLCAPSLPHSRPLVSPGKDLVYSSGMLTATQGTPLDSNSEIYDRTHVRLYTFAHLKLVPEGLAPSSLNLNAG